MRLLPRKRAAARAAGPASEADGLSAPFADRLAALTEERRSQLCLGLDPDPAELPAATAPDASGLETAERAATAVVQECRRLIELAGHACVAVKPQLACFERLGAPGWRALEEVCAGARGAGLLVVADGKRGDVPVTARAYGQALVGETPTPWGSVRGLGADAFTANPLLGEDAVDVLVEAARDARAGVFLLVRTSNPGAAALQDAALEGRPLHERLAELVAERAPQLGGEGGLSGMGAVVGATAPQHLGRLRELMPDSIFLVPGVGAQGGRPEELGPALAPGRPASLLVAAARSIAGADDPGEAAERLRASIWSLSG
ncbi:MAG: orotidine-5'-phosphate decarboxylase [Solirubrobacterales bacterium]